RSRRCTRSVTAGADMPTRRPSADIVIRGSACSSASRATFTSSSRSLPGAKAVTSEVLDFEGNTAKAPSYCPSPSLAEPTRMLTVTTTADHPAAQRPATSALTRLPPASYFLTSAVFHYLGPSFAVLLFARVDVLGVAWLRIASAAAV